MDAFFVSEIVLYFQSQKEHKKSDSFVDELTPVIIGYHLDRVALLPYSLLINSLFFLLVSRVYLSREEVDGTSLRLAHDFALCA